MYEFIKNAVFILLFVSLGFSVAYSVKYRKQTDPYQRSKYQAKQNTAMGLMMILLAVYPLYLMPGTTISITIGIIFLLIGLFNLFVGVRNQFMYRSKSE